MPNLEIDPMALTVARSLFGFTVKATALAYMVDGVLPWSPTFFGIETPYSDYLRVSDGYTRALSLS